MFIKSLLDRNDNPFNGYIFRQASGVQEVCDLDSCLVMKCECGGNYQKQIVLFELHLKFGGLRGGGCLTPRGFPVPLRVRWLPLPVQKTFMLG